MADSVDIANDYNGFWLDWTVKNWPKDQGRYSMKVCVDCGDEIPLQRRQSIPGTRRCVFCEQSRKK